jgi:hypothetical protein
MASLLSTPHIDAISVAWRSGLALEGMSQQVRCELHRHGEGCWNTPRPVTTAP